MKIQRGDILLVHSRFNLVGWIIQKITKSYWNHVAWALSSGTLIESTMYGVHLAPMNKYRVDDPKRVKVVRIFPDHITPEHMDMALTVASTHIGNRYDVPKIIGLLWLMILGIRREIGLGDWKHAWICSELVAEPLYKISKFQFIESIPVDNVIPKDIEQSKKVYPIVE